MCKIKSENWMSPLDSGFGPRPWSISTYLFSTNYSIWTKTVFDRLYSAINMFSIVYISKIFDSFNVPPLSFTT